MADPVSILNEIINDLRQSLIGGIEGVKANRPMLKWAMANEKLLIELREEQKAALAKYAEGLPTFEPPTTFHETKS